MLSINFNKDEFEKLIRTVVQEELGSAQDCLNKASQKPLYTNKEMLELLDVNSKTLKKYRDNGWLGYSQVGDKFYYSADDLNSFLAKTHQDAFAWN
ncbi:MAG: helix-turn-helix domain-containing protein [Alistipes sp.]|nr:helix-turn-helix domain-containing protein [Alistipes sp.]